MHTPTELKQWCAQYGLTPSKAFGQNYLLSQAAIDHMIDAAGISSADTIIEIGPGFGVLTETLAERAHHVFALEIEQTLRPYWEDKLPSLPALEIIWGNALNTIHDVISSLEGKPFKVVANLPYQITSHVIRTILELPTPPSDMVVMVQKEVAQRICAQPGDMSVLAVAVQYYGEPKYVATVKKGSFWPAPKVDSAIVHVGQITAQSEAKEFFELVRAGFSNKRKQAAKNISAQLFIERATVEEALEALNIRRDVRAEMLSVEDWIALQNKLRTSLGKA
jgi:16S rRNA (adenine1518-N6/adenine1519-N6)-dimethyltransferase